MKQQVFASTNPSYKTAGRAAIISGVTGALAAGCLIAFLRLRNTNLDAAMFMLKFHDFGLILQLLFMVPVIAGLQKLTQKQSPGTVRGTLAIGIGAICFVILFLLLTFLKLMSDLLYSFPLGILGVWLVGLNWRLSGLLPRWLTWFGMVVGLGLALFGSFEPGYAIFVDTVMLRIPAAPLEDYPVNYTPANLILHQILGAGSIMGVYTLPIWTLLTGRVLLLKKQTAAALS